MNRKLHNTYSALSVTAFLLTAGLIVARPAPQADAMATVAATTVDNSPATPTDRQQRQARAERSARIVEASVQSRTAAIEARADALGEPLEHSADLGKLVDHVADFTAEVAVETAMMASIDELSKLESTTMDTIEPGTRAVPASKPRRSHRPLAMPYFSFASRG